MFNPLNLFRRAKPTAAKAAAAAIPSTSIAGLAGSKIRGLGQRLGPGGLSRMAIGGGVGLYSSRNEEGWGRAGGVAGGMAAGAFLGKYMPPKLGRSMKRELFANKEFTKQFMAHEGKKLTGTGFGGWARRNQMFKYTSHANKAIQYGLMAGAAGMGAGLGSSMLRSNNPY